LLPRRYDVSVLSLPNNWRPPTSHQGFAAARFSKFRRNSRFYRRRREIPRIVRFVMSVLVCGIGLTTFRIAAAGPKTGESRSYSSRREETLRDRSVGPKSRCARVQKTGVWLVHADFSHFAVYEESSIIALLAMRFSQVAKLDLRIPILRWTKAAEQLLRCICRASSTVRPIRRAPARCCHRTFAKLSKEALPDFGGTCDPCFSLNARRSLSRADMRAEKNVLVIRWTLLTSGAAVSWLP